MPTDPPPPPNQLLCVYGQRTLSLNSLLQLCIEPQEVNSVANTISRITRIHHQPPNNVHLSYSGEHGQDSETVSAHDRHRMCHTQAAGTSVWHIWIPHHPLEKCLWVFYIVRSTN